MATGSRTALRLGLTGGIGSGKSTVGQMLADQGAALIDADRLSRQVTAPGGAAIEPIRDAFGDALIDAHGAMDRDRMRKLVFTDPAARQRLERIVHPLVAQATREAASRAVQSGAALIVFDIPLLVESARWAQQLDQILVVDCTAETQISRVQQRSALARETIEGIMASQAPRAIRRAAADLVVYNDGISLQGLRADVLQIAQRFGL
ncbi:dephospho-CoA kinase [Acidovorax sp. SUPP2522]|uniref:dephospho-CoA kinase n=1 Tax=unclassified Acidovorax TaxID=2684926 RepID=UPI00234AD1BA|nr:MULTISPECIES: dephospho-CoA kinase [unclassified Acidovorax]WCM97236.1 dephospho-CoA kinase [Acidovorax sp. GBBC 1281]GKT16022.1 dephospho-CoA kinase [Acidovorax sp. SUPP2522]